MARPMGRPTSSRDIGAVNKGATESRRGLALTRTNAPLAFWSRER
jgi:hypothetical protein